MKRFCLLLLALNTYCVLKAQESVPVQYQLIKEVIGDLDRDGIAEKAGVYNTKAAEQDEGVDREVIIFKKTRTGWRIWHQSSTAVGNSKDGGMMGDPFEDIEITQGILLISQSGGSSWKWGYTDKYRFQNNSFELIGHTSKAGKPCEHWVSYDYNLSTGNIEYRKEYEKCDDRGGQQVYKKEAETFRYKLTKKITLATRKADEIKIVTPKYKEELYL